MLTAFRWREYKRNKRLFPIVYVSTAGLIKNDLDYYEPVEGDLFLTEKTLIDFTSASDRVFDRINKSARITFAIYIFLVAQYVSINLEFTILGFSIKAAPGVTEILLLYVTISLMLIAIWDRNHFLINEIRKFLISKIYPEELHTPYLIRHFPSEQAGLYMPFNAIHLLPKRTTSRIATIALILILIVVIVPLLLGYMLTVFFIAYDMIQRPSFPFWSPAVGVYAIVIHALTVVYFFAYRIWLPYTDFTLLHTLELAKQWNPQEYARIRTASYQESVADRQDLRRRGYL
ncbi:MAG: hypothetical protein JJ864_02150 [Rhizobiaceae bacterium]|nr:hypothetical protein [Rhizobiaceae bacterium]